MTIRLIHDNSVDELFIVRLYDGFDNQWMDVTGAVSRAEADRIWSEKTENGTKNKSFDDIDYYRIFPADTKMVFAEGRGEMKRL
jgi:hypothetical protein